MSRFIFVILLALCAACSAPAPQSEPEASPDPAPEATSLLGEPLFIVETTGQTRDRQEADLAAAQADFDSDPAPLENIIWRGRRTAYLGRYSDAIQIYTDGLDRFPNEPHLLRHRGHRYLSIRQIDKAVADFEAAARAFEGQEDEVEPDGQPNARNQPTSTLQFNVWYHLALAHYLAGRFESAREAYEACMRVSKNNDAVVATSHWLYMTHRRLGDETAAEQVLEPITQDMDIIENGSYHRLLLLYKGIVEPDSIWDPTTDDLASATVGYGIGNWHFYNGRDDTAFEIFEKIHGGSQWASFGYLATEAELARRAN